MTEHEAFATSGRQFYVYQLARITQRHNVTIITHPDRRRTSLLLVIPILSNGDETKTESEKSIKLAKKFE